MAPPSPPQALAILARRWNTGARQPPDLHRSGSVDGAPNGPGPGLRRSVSAETIEGNCLGPTRTAS
jgi:hypothetical protein